LRNTVRLIPSRYPSTGILDTIARPEDLDAVIELESWTNDRISEQIGILHRIPGREWVTGKPMSTVVMAAFSHPRPSGGRFNSGERGAWYSSTSLDTAHAEVLFHRSQELSEVGVTDAYLEVRAYLADFRGPFHDLRQMSGAIFSKTSYAASQRLAADLLAAGSNGVIYPSVRRPEGTCIACFRPKLVANVRAGAHFGYTWEQGREPSIARLG
jgi:RES domain-containing protein